MKEILPMSTIDDLAATFEHLASKYPPEELQAQIEDSNTTLGRFMIALNDFSNQIQFASDTWKEVVTDIEKVDDKYTFHIGEKEYKVGNGKMTPRSGKGGEVTGKEADYFILAKETNLERVPLYSSGFYIVLRGARLSELNNFFNYVSSHLGTQGNMLGVIYYLFSDLDIVRKTWSLVRSLIIDSNLAKWDKENRLENYISLNDLSLILLRVGRLMYPHGFEYISICGSVTGTGTEKSYCDYTAEEKVDLNELQMTDFSRIPDEQVPIIASSKTVSTEEAHAYRKALEENFNTFTMEGYKFYMVVPTLRMYFNTGDTFNMKLIKSVANLKDDDEISNFIRFNTSGIFSCWIAKIEAVNDEGTVDFILTDKDKIELIMSQLELRDKGNELLENIRVFIKKSLVTHIGYSANACPKCGKIPSQAVNGFIPFDPRTSFFTMSAMRLTQAS